MAALDVWTNSLGVQMNENSGQLNRVEAACHLAAKQHLPEGHDPDNALVILVANSDSDNYPDHHCGNNHHYA